MDPILREGKCRKKSERAKPSQKGLCVISFLFHCEYKVKLIQLPSLYVQMNLDIHHIPDAVQKQIKEHSLIKYSSKERELREFLNDSRTARVYSNESHVQVD